MNYEITIVHRCIKLVFNVLISIMKIMKISLLFFDNIIIITITMYNIDKTICCKLH